ncbi:UDP-N-acetylmuramate--L-alanine ligase [Patescibacteria group bacterium]|nr:UDP-N-acetylmuramate--L-alanine ligase [Patescibacteria group bacterium]
MNWFRAKTIHFSGIKGVGMAALAGIALDLKKIVSGSDTDEIFPTDTWLKSAKIKLKVGFSAKHLPKGCDLLVYTGAHQGVNNPEVIAAKKQGISVLNYAQALAQVAEVKTLVATAGVGGKSTTAAMIATILETAGVKPSWAVGVGSLNPIGQPGRWRKNSQYLVAESDEFVADPAGDLTPKFHYLKPNVAVITNLEHDHPDIYPTINEVFASFSAFTTNLKPGGVVVANLDNLHLKDWLKTIDKPLLTYGFSPQADWQIFNVHLAFEKQLFSLRFKNMVYDELILNLPGRYNLSNAAAAFAVTHYLGIEPGLIAKGIKAFLGAKRRFELIADVNKIRLYDDYAHHPIEVRAVLEAAKNWLPGRRLIAIFQSHTYSRTKALLPQFVTSLLTADVILINDIFSSARETETLGVSGQVLTQMIRAQRQQVYYAPGKAATLTRLKGMLKHGDVILTLGAGNNWLWHKEIIKLMRQV